MNDVKQVVVAGKVQTVVTIDGQDYLEDGMVAFYPARREAAACGRKVVFVEGETYKNFFGEAKVMHLKADTMVVQYQSVSTHYVTPGQVCEYPIRAQAEAVVKAAMRNEAEMVKAGVAVIKAGDMPLVNWIAEKGTIRAQMRPDMREKFEEMYEDMTGEKADPRFVYEGASYFEGAFALNAEFPKPPAGVKVDVPQGVVIHVVGGTCRIWCNAYVKGMFKVGLKLGTNESAKLAA